MNHTRLRKTEEERLRAQVDELLRAAEESDATEDAPHGKGNRGDDLPKKLHTKEDAWRQFGRQGSSSGKIDVMKQSCMSATSEYQIIRPPFAFELDFFKMSRKVFATHLFKGTCRYDTKKSVICKDG